MTHKFTNSSQLASASYKRSEQKMTLTFKRGGAYEYLDVPEGVYESLTASNSPGSYFYKNIKAEYDTNKL